MSNKRASSVTGSLYPSLAEEEEHDILSTTLGIPPTKSKKPAPARPPPPSKSHSVPVAMGREQKGPETEKVYIPPPLQPHEIRWFYQEPGKFWQAFSGYDSLCLERTHLDQMGQSLDEGQASKSAEGRDSRDHGEVSVMGGLYVVLIHQRLMVPVYWPTPKEKWNVMRGCWFEVVGEKWYPFCEADCAIIENEHCQKKWRERAKKDADLQSWATTPPPQPTTRTTNGSTAATSSPSATRSLSTSGSSTTSAPPAAPEALEDTTVAVHKLAMEKYDIVWLANADIYKMKKELSSQLWNKMGQKLGKGTQFGGTKVRRGYKEYASGDDGLPPVGHVVFVTHGIGQNMDSASIEQSTRDFREACIKVAKSCFADSWREKRVEFIPVEWRTGLSLDQGLVTTITPNTLKRLRGLMNDCVMDVFYYFSPKFGPEILNGLKTALQSQYNKFMRRNPGFLGNGGTVSVIAHSLGSVMLYDLLREKCDLDPEVRTRMMSTSGQNSYSSETSSLQQEGVEGEGMDFVDGSIQGSVSEEVAMKEELKALKKRIAYLEHQLVLKQPPVPLSFSIDHFFAFGSPTALFIAMKEYETLVSKNMRSAESFLPSCVCKRIHNVQHPSDPIAYRLEPLVNPLYTQVKPVKMSSAKSKISQDMVDYAEGPRSEKELNAQPAGKSWLSNQLQTVGASIMSLASGKKGSNNSAPTNSTDGPDTPTQATEKVMDSDKHLDPSVKLKERLDFTMKESVMENSYLNSLTAHTSYWTSADCAQYVLLQLYKYKAAT